MNESQLKILGVSIADKAENILELSTNAFMTREMIIDAMHNALLDIMRDARALYVDISGENPWNGIGGA